MAHLEGVSIFHVRHAVDARPTTQPMIVPPCDRLALPGIARQLSHEAVQAIRFEPIRPRKLPKKRSGLLPQRQHTAREKVAERCLDVPELEVVCDETTALDGEGEVVRHFRCPALKHGGRLETVEGAVQLDAIELPARVLEPAPGRQLRRIEPTAPALIVVAADSDE